MEKRTKVIIDNEIFTLHLVESFNAVGYTDCTPRYFIKETQKYGWLTFFEVPSWELGRFEISEFITEEELENERKRFTNEIRPELEKIDTEGMDRLDKENKLYA